MLQFRFKKKLLEANKKPHQHFQGSNKNSRDRKQQQQVLVYGALILLFGQQTVYLRLFLFFFYETVTKSQTFWIPNKFNASRK